MPSSTPSISRTILSCCLAAVLSFCPAAGRAETAFANGTFDSAAGWETRGTVTIGDGVAVLAEGGIECASLTQPFDLPAAIMALRFDITGLNLVASTGNSFEDAFQVSLMDAPLNSPIGDSLVEISQPDASSFFNLQQTGVVYFGSQVSILDDSNVASGDSWSPALPVTISLNLSSLQVDQRVKLIFDLVCEPSNTASTVTIDNVRLLGPPPEAVNDSATTNEDTAKTINVLANDYDPQHDRIDPTSVTIVSGPDHGIAVPDPGTGVVTYTPALDYHGGDSFTYRFRDRENPNPEAVAPVTVSITVNPVNDPPLITSTAVTGVDEDTLYSYTVAASDVDSGSLAYSALVKPAWLGFDPDTHVLSGTPTNDNVGTHNVVLRVSDGVLYAEQSFSVTVANVNDPPVIAQGDSITAAAMDEDSTPTGWSPPTLTAGDVDVGDSLTWSVGSQPAHGTAAVSGVGPSPVIFTYVPAADWNGTDSIPVRVTDASGASDTILVQVPVTPVNDPPVVTGQAHALATDEDIPLALAVTDLVITDPDDTYPGGFTLAVQSGANYTVAGQTITPGADYSGTLTVPVQVNDGEADSNIFNLSVTVNPVNDPPVIGQGDTVTATAMDEDGAPTAWSAPTLSATDVDDNIAALTWSLATPPSHGSVTVTGTGNSPSAFTFVPAADWNGADSFVVRVTDGSNATDTVTVQVTVNPVNDSPVINQADPIVAAAMSEDAAPIAWSAPLLTAADVDAGDTLTWSLATPPSHGTATVSGTGNTPAVFTYAPAADWNGDDSFVVRVTDSVAATDTVTVQVTVTPVNDPPVIDQGGSVSVTMDEDGAPTSWSAPVLTAADVDAGDVLTWSLATPPSHGTATVGGTGNTPAVFTYAPAVDWNGADSFIVQVADGSNATDTVTVQVTVTPVNDPPVADAGPDLLAGEGTLVTLDGSGSTDIDNSLTYAWLQTGGTAVILSDAGAVRPTFTAPEIAGGRISLTFTLTATDAGSLADTDTVSVVVPNIAVRGDADDDRTVGLADCLVALQIVSRLPAVVASVAGFADLDGDGAIGLPEAVFILQVVAGLHPELAVDNDNDGFTELAGDCDDADLSIYPGATEICGDAIIQDCGTGELQCP